MFAASDQLDIFPQGLLRIHGGGVRFVFFGHGGRNSNPRVRATILPERKRHANLAPTRFLPPQF